MKKHIGKRTVFSVFLSILAAALLFGTVMLCKNSASANTEPAPQTVFGTGDDSLTAENVMLCARLNYTPTEGEAPIAYPRSMPSKELANAKADENAPQSESVDTSSPSGESADASTPSKERTPSNSQSAESTDVNLPSAESTHASTASNSQSAESTDANLPSGESTVTTPPSNERMPSNEIKSEGTDEKTTSSTEADLSDNDPSETRRNVFEEIFNWFKEYSGDIFSALAFIVGLAVAFFYKRGLVPGISRVGASIKSSVDASLEGNERLSKEATLAREQSNERLDTLLEKLSRLGSELDTMKEQLDLTGALEERARLQEVLLMEIDMLYTVFTTSSLPEYMKEELSRRVGAMRKELALND